MQMTYHIMGFIVKASNILCLQQLLPQTKCCQTLRLPTQIMFFYQRVTKVSWLYDVIKCIKGSVTCSQMVAQLITWQLLR